MKVRQWVASISASFDDFVSKIENHEAIADSVIADVRKGAARLRVQRARLSAEIEQARGNALRAQEAAATWEQRALSLPAEQEARALECIARAQQAQARGAAAEQQASQSEAIVSDIERALADVEGQLTQLKLRRSTLASRDIRANVLVRSQDAGLREAADSVFERWEQTVIEKEYFDDGVIEPDVDLFAQPFAAVEREAELQQRLHALQALRQTQENDR